MKLVVILAIWKRHDLEKIVIERLIEQSKKYNFEIIIAGSEEEKSKLISKGCHYIEVDNFPVSNKHNLLLQKAKELNPSGIVLLGSDDLVNDKFWELTIKYTGKEQRIIGLKDLYFYCTKEKKIGYFDGYVNGTQSIGAGRYFSRYILDKMNFKFWDENLNKGLDGNCNKNLLKNGITDSVYSMKESKVFLIDIKHSVSITKRNIINACKGDNTKLIKENLGAKYFNKINQLEIIEINWEELPNSLNIIVVSNTKHLKIGEIYECEKSTARAIVEKGHAILI